VTNAEQQIESLTGLITHFLRFARREKMAEEAAGTATNRAG